jgi:hypothetical protein
VLGHQPQPDQAAPVLSDDGEPAQVEAVERERAGPLHVPSEAVVADLGRLVRTAEPHQVRRDGAQARVREHRHDLAVKERPARLPVQQQHGLAVGRTGLHVGDPEPVDVAVPRRIAEIRQIGETILWRAQHLHADMLPRMLPRRRQAPTAPGGLDHDRLPTILSHPLFE